MDWRSLAPTKQDALQGRLKLVVAALLAVFLLLWGRLFFMQVVDGPRYRQQALTNSLRLVPQRAPRGLILDRNLEVIASNAPSLSLGLMPAPLLHDPERREEVVQRLAGLLGQDAEAIRKKLALGEPRPFAPVRLATDVDRGLVLALEEQRDQLPGVVVIEESKRSYPRRMAVHALGYVGEITEGELESLGPKGYRRGDLVGQTGLEKVYDSVLRGEDGGYQVQVNAAGREQKVEGRVPVVPGRNLVLTLDARLQEAAEEALGENSGAVVAMDPRNGEVLALVSHPDYDLAAFANRILSKDWQALAGDDRHPMSDRVLQGLYPPGSVFKIVTTAAGLESGAITPDTTFDCMGIYWISTWPYRCWKEVGHGSISLHRALVESCDVYFYHVGLRVKVDQLHQMAADFGLGTPTGIDLPGESSGLVPDARWKEKTQHMPWFPGNTVMMSIGQGYLLATPLQLAQLASAVANGGDIYRPHLLKRITDASGAVLEEPAPQVSRRLPCSADTLRAIRRGMTDAVNAPGGTGWRARVAGVDVAGKTGTAQNPHGEDHADFISYAPAEAPRLAVAVVVENGGEGGLTAAPIAKRLYEVYFGK